MSESPAETPVHRTCQGCLQLEEQVQSLTKRVEALEQAPARETALLQGFSDRMFSAAAARRSVEMPAARTVSLTGHHGLVFHAPEHHEAHLDDAGYCTGVGEILPGYRATLSVAAAKEMQMARGIGAATADS